MVFRSGIVGLPCSYACASSAIASKARTRVKASLSFRAEEPAPDLIRGKEFQCVHRRRSLAFVRDDTGGGRFLAFARDDTAHGRSLAFARDETGRGCSPLDVLVHPFAP